MSVREDWLVLHLRSVLKSQAVLIEDLQKRNLSLDIENMRLKALNEELRLELRKTKRKVLLH